MNRSAAVMARRREPTDSLDDFPTPPWATRALIEQLRAITADPDLDCHLVWEPAANRGFMVRPLRETFMVVYASDIHDYGAGFPLHDFTGGALGQRSGWKPPRTVDWVITNPPFVKSLEFVERALEIATTGVAIFARTSWLESEPRYTALFAAPARRPTFWFQFVERVCILKGRMVRVGEIDPLTDEPAATATSYGWAVWLKGTPPDDTRLRWIEPCRLRLERPGDYDQC